MVKGRSEEGWEEGEEASCWKVSEENEEDEEDEWKQEEDDAEDDELEDVCGGVETEAGSAKVRSFLTSTKNEVNWSRVSLYW